MIIIVLIVRNLGVLNSLKYFQRSDKMKLFEKMKIKKLIQNPIRHEEYLKYFEEKRKEGIYILYGEWLLKIKNIDCKKYGL
jgi:hypothetical protein